MGETVSVKSRGGLFFDLQDSKYSVNNRDRRKGESERESRTGSGGGCGRYVQGMKKDEHA